MASKTHHILTKRLLKQRFLIDCCSIDDLVNQTGYSRSTIGRWLKIYKIQRKFRSGNLTNKNFEKLKALYRIGLKGKTILWHCLCSCGKTVDVSAGSLLSGNTKSCGCLNHRRGCASASWRGTGLLSKSHWNKIVKSAKVRNIEVLLTSEEAWNIYVTQQGKCALTAWPINLDLSDHTASLDRIDSNLQYSKDNVQWLHKDVNFMKHITSNEAFINLCRAVCSFKDSKK